MWGKVYTATFAAKRIRITPTHVGKRITFTVTALSAEDHPHPCGEKSALVSDTDNVIGSPPPMWGKALFNVSVDVASGITPTHVGKRFLKL